VAKKSKLHEKATRMPDIRQAKWEQVVSAYLESVQAQQSESAKSHRFAGLLNELFGLQQPGFIEDYVAGITTGQRLGRLFKKRLEEAFPHVTDPLVMTNSRNAPLYCLIFAGHKQKASEIVQDILQRYERLGR